MSEYTPYARYYDLAHDTQKDVSFYLNYAKQSGGPVLELACGTGRLVVPLAKAGYMVHGVDLSEQMLSVQMHLIPKAELIDNALVLMAFHLLHMP